jgi:putative DNA modification/repair radical SAM protein
MDLASKLSILADAAKYDASCSSSGTTKRDARAGGLGSTSNGICHSFTPDGRCVSLLKILLTNYCTYDCLYCINRVSSNVQRARFTVDEVVKLTLDFYRRNYIEGLFLSSGIIRNPDYTMEQVVAVAKALREEHQFRGYIHLKTIPEASQALIDEAGRYADRISINVELPTSGDLQKLAPEKNLARIRLSMDGIKARVQQSKAERAKSPKAPPYAPAGQTTQMIVGATPTPDRDVLAQASTLYRAHQLRRIYYSAFSPIPDSSSKLALTAPPLVREHRLYQSDWLMRFYGFDAAELTSPDEPNLDPKLAWALRHREKFPVDVNKAPREMLLRVPGLGVRNVDRIVRIRRWQKLRLADLARLRVPLKKTLPFIVAADHTPHLLGLDRDGRLGEWMRPVRQLELFGGPVQARSSVVTGEL